MYKAFRLFAVLAGMAMLAGGCGGKSEDGNAKAGGAGNEKAGGAATASPSGAPVAGGGGGERKAKTPREVIANMSKAIDTGDKAMFLSTAYFGESPKEVGEAMFDGIAAMMGLLKDLDKTYGKDANSPMGDMSNEAPIFTDAEIAKIDVKEEGDKASAVNPKDKKPMKFMKKDGVWYADMSEDMPPAAQRDGTIKQSKAMVKAVGDVRAKIGKTGMTRDKIMQELMGAMMKASMSADANS